MNRGTRLNRFPLGLSTPLVCAGLGSAVLLASGTQSSRAHAQGSDSLDSQRSLAAPLRTKQQAVLGGGPSEQEGVVFVSARPESFTPAACSGTLIAPNIVVTALHCVSEYVAGFYKCDIEGGINDSVGREPPNAGNMGAPFSPESITIHVTSPADEEQVDGIGRAVFAPQTSSICRNDIAFIVLDRELDIPFVPLRVGSGLVPGETLTVAGYGTSETSALDRNERSGIEIEGVGPSEFYDVEGQAPPRTFVVGQGPCPGDSGGPAISDETGELVGVFSFWTGSDCSSPLVRAFYSQAAAFDPFLRAAFEEAGYLELIEPEPEPGTGGAGGEGSGPNPEAGAGAAEPEPGSGGEGSGGNPEPPESGGCSMVAPVGSSGAGLPWLLALATAAFCRRRLRSSCSG